MEILVLLALAATILGYFIYTAFFSREATIKRHMRRTPRIPIQQFPEASIGRITGELVILGEPLLSPLTGRRCAHYYVVVEEYRSSGEAHRWETIIEEEDSQNFILKDETGEALIRMNVAEVAVTKDAEFKSGTSEGVTPDQENFLAKHGHKSKGWLFNRELRYREAVLEDGEQVTVHGFGSWESNLDPVTLSTTSGADGKGSDRLVMNYSDEVSLYVTDDHRIAWSPDD